MGYLISIDLFELTIANAKEVFESFSSFVGYSQSGFYIRENTGDKIKYYFISYDDELKGLYCEVTFR